MPRAYTRAAVSTSEDKHALHATSRLVINYCACGEFTLVIDKSLSLLPRRRTDGSHVLRNGPPSHPNARSYKLNAKPDKSPVLMRRKDGGYEKQWRFRCVRCELVVGYEVGGGPSTFGKGQFTYILHGALTDTQAAAPPGALDPDPATTAQAIAAAREAKKRGAKEDNAAASTAAAVPMEVDS